MPSSTKWRLNASVAEGAGNIGLAGLEMMVAVGGADQCSGGTASAYQTSEGSPDNAFDSDDATVWVSNQAPTWIQYEFATAVEILQYAITARPTYASNAPEEFTFEYFDGADWQMVDTRTGQTDWEANERRLYTVGHGNASKTKWRLYVTEAENDNVGLAGLEMMISAGGADQCSDGIATAYHTYTGSAANAFDKDDATIWVDNTHSTTPTWIQYEFLDAVDIVEYAITARPTSATNAPKNFTFEYWDGADWQLADGRSGETGWTANETRTYEVSASAAAAQPMVMCVG